MKKRAALLWISAFILLFLLSQDYLFLSWESKASLFGLPPWLPWFAFVHIVFIGAFWIFSKKHWR